MTREADVMKMIQCNTNLGHVNLISYTACTDRSVNKFSKNQDYGRPNGDINHFHPEHPKTLQAQNSVAQV